MITLGGVLCVVPDSLFVRLIEAAPLTIAFWRVTLVGLVVGAALWLRGGAAPFRDFAGGGWSAVVYAVGTGASGVLFVLAVSLTSVANVVFIIASLPVFAALFSRVMLGEPFSRRMMWTLAAVVPGLAIIAYGSGRTEGAHWAGDLLALTVSALFAAALTAARHMRSRSMVPGVAVGYLLAGAAVGFWAAPLSLPPGQIGLVLAHAAMIAASAVLLAQGPRYIASAEVGLLILLESALAPLLVWAVIGENPGRHALMGGAVVLGALALSNVVALRRAGRRRAAPRATSEIRNRP